VTGARAGLTAAIDLYRAMEMPLWLRRTEADAGSVSSRRRKTSP
jgi:hypothetical protein